ncbi:MAG: substrate-binding domain-containing protein [Chthoniobacteraceae bacterium]
MKIARTQLKHQRVEAEIRRLVQTLPVGAKLPAERDMAESYNCNFLTVRKALKQMVDDGSIVRRVGSGTFVAKAAETLSADKNGKAVGMLVGNESNAYAFRVIQAVAQAGQEQGVDLKSGWVRDFSDEALAQAQQFQKDGCVALTLPWFPHEKTEEVRDFVQRCPLPVSIAMLIPGLERNCFTRPDTFGTSTSEAIESLCNYFSLLGHQRIALIGPDSASDVLLQKRLSAYACFTSRENLINLCGLVGPGAQAMDQLAERWKGYQGDLAIISYDDEHALRFMTAMHKLGLSAPEDYKIIGYNDTEGSRYSDPPLSTIHQNFDHIGTWLLKSALSLAQGETCQSPENPRPIMLVRSTCGGRDKINDELRRQLPDIDITVDENGHTPELPQAILAS